MESMHCQAYDLAVEAADIPAVQHHNLAHIKEQELDEVHKLRHGIRKDEIKHVARLAQDLVEADEDAEVGDDAEILEYTHGAGDHGASDGQRRKEQADDQRHVDDAVITRIRAEPAAEQER